MLRERHVHVGCRSPALARGGLVDDDGKGVPSMFVADLVEDEGKFLYRGDDDCFVRFQVFAQVARVFGMAYGGRDLGELFDGIPDLFVHHAPVGDDDD